MFSTIMRTTHTTPKTVPASSNRFMMRAWRASHPFGFTATPARAGWPTGSRARCGSWGRPARRGRRARRLDLRRRWYHRRMIFSKNPEIAEQQMIAIIVYLTTFGYIDGNFDLAEKVFVLNYIRSLVEMRVAEQGERDENRR